MKFDVCLIMICEILQPTKRRRNKNAERESDATEEKSESLYFKSSTHKSKQVSPDVGTESSIQRDLKAIFSEVGYMSSLYLQNPMCIMY